VFEIMHTSKTRQAQSFHYAITKVVTREHMTINPSYAPDNFWSPHWRRLSISLPI